MPNNGILSRTTISATLSWFMKLILAWLFFFAISKGDYFLGAASIAAIALSVIPSILGRNTQYGLDNTMWDLVNNLIGGVVAALLGIIYVRFSRPEERKRVTRTVGEVFSIRK